MRLLFLVLLLANVVVFAWHVFVRSDDTVEGAVTPGAGHQLRLLSEVQGVPPGDSPVVSSRGRQCFAVGPLDDRLAAQIEQSLRAQGFEFAAGRQQQLEPLGFWVYLPPAPSLTEAQSVGRQLADRGITDYVFVVGAEKANAISLGLYPDEQKARTRVTQLQALGFEPKLEKRYARKELVEFTVALDQGDPPQVPAALPWRPVDCQPQRQ